MGAGRGLAGPGGPAANGSSLTTLREYEHPLARWDRLGISYNVLSESEHGYWVNRNKHGNRSWARAQFMENPVTTLVSCELCGKTGTPRNVNFKNGVFGWDVDEPFPYKESRSTLCTGCWNRVRAIVRQEREAAEIRRLTNRLKREVEKWRKSQRRAI